MESLSFISHLVLCHDPLLTAHTEKCPPARQTSMVCILKVLIQGAKSNTVAVLELIRYVKG